MSSSSSTSRRRARRRRRRASARGRASPPPSRRRPPSAARALPGRARGSATAASGGGSARTARGRAARAASRAAPAPSRSPCASAAPRTSSARLHVRRGARRRRSRRRRSAAASRTGSPRRPSRRAAWSDVVVERPRPSTTTSTCERDDLVALALDLVHHDRARDVEPAGRRARLRQLAGERHRDAAAVRRGEQLLRARLALGLPDPRRQRELEPGERAGPGGDRAGPARDVPFPDDFGGALDSRHQLTRLRGGRAVGVIGLGGRAGRAEHAEHGHLARADVLEPVHEAAPADARRCPPAAARLSPSMWSSPVPSST